MQIIWLFTLKKVRLHNLKLILLAILQVFNIECHGQASKSCEASIEKTKSLSHSLFYSAGKNLFSKN